MHSLLMSKLIEELEMKVLSLMPLLEKCKNEPFIRNHSMLVIELIKTKNVALRFVFVQDLKSRLYKKALPESTLSR